MGSKPSFTGAVSWSILDSFLNFGISLIISAFLARLIEPKEFGLLAMVGVFTGLLSVFKNFGLNTSLIYKQNISSQEIDSIFWFSIFSTFFFSIIIFFSAPFISAFYHNSRLIPITQAMAILFFLGSLSSVPDALIRKALDFKVFFFRNISNKIISGLVGIALAINGFGVWALIIQSFISSIYMTIVSFRMVSWRPGFYFNFKILIPHLKYSFPLLSLKVLYNLTNNIDSILIGKFYGAQPLAFYNKAYGLMRLPLGKISSSVSRVLFPSISSLNHNYSLVWKKYLKLMQVTAYISFPLMSVMFLLGDEIILLVYGKNWMPSIWIFKGFAFIGALQTLTYSGTILQSIGKTKLLFKLNTSLKVVMIFFIIVGLVLAKIPGVIIGYSLGMLLEVIVGTYFVGKSLNHNPWTVFYKLKYELTLTFILTFFSYFIINFVSLFFDGLILTFIKLIIIFAFIVLPYLYVSKRKNLEGYLFVISQIRKLKQFKKD